MGFSWTHWVLGIAVLIAACAPASSDDGPPGGDVRLDVRTDRVLCRKLLGFGAQGDYFLTCGFNTGRGVTDQDRELVRKRVQAMRPQIIRTFFSYKWWEPEEGRQTPDSEAMRDYVAWVRFLKSIGCKVMMNPWGDCFAYSDWMKPGGTKLPAPEKREAMVRSLVDLVGYLRTVQHLTNVSYVTLMNEPDNDSNRPVDVDEFVRLNELLDRMLRDRGLRRGVFLVGVDGSSWNHAKPGEWFYEVTKRGVDYADGCAAHTYGHKDVPTLVPWIHSRTDALKAVSRKGATPKPFMITEFSTYGDTFRNFDNDTYEHGLFLADFAVTALREGTSAVLMWCLFDTYYDDVNEQQYGLWRYKDKGWEPRPGFYSWSLITRYSRPGSRVVAVECDPAAPSVRAVGLVSQEGRMTVLVVNRYRKSLTARLRLDLDHKTELRVFRYTRQTVPTHDRAMIPASDIVTVSPGEGTNVALPAESFVLITDLP